MKRITCLTALICFITLSLSAQTKEEKAAQKHREAIQKSREKGTVILDQDTIYNSGAAYGILKNEGTAILPKYRGYALSGEEAFFFDGASVKTFWRISFSSLDGKQVEIPMDFKVPVYQLVANNDLLTPTSLNKEKARYFLMKYGPHKAGTVPGAEINQVERNRKEMVLAMNNTIYQDKKVIGTYETKTEATKEYGSRKVCYIYFPTGALCSKAILGAGDPTKAAVTTYKDDKTQTVTDPVLEVDDIAKYLSDNLYL